jgi:hypothetical protein
MKARLIVSLIIALMLVTVLALPAMAEEYTETASVTVTEYINFTITDYDPDGLQFGSLAPGATNQTEVTQNATHGAVTLTVGSDTNVDCYIQVKGTDFAGTPSGTLAIGNAKWDDDNNVAGATAMTMSYVNIDSSTAGVAKIVDVWHWLSIPSAQVAASYSSTFYYQAIKQ